MKTKKLIYSLVLFAGFALSSCAANETATDESLVTEAALNVIAADDAVIQAINCPTTTTETLTEEEKSGLLLMREEEKLAHDVYVYFYQKYNHRVFNNISKSETQHTEAVLRLIKLFGLSDPATTNEGEYDNEAIQGLYNSLIAQGNTLNAALATGAYIEEYDIKDLQDLLAVTQNSSVKKVYTNLLRGSTNHLKAFTGILKLYGISYVPKILSQSEYEALISK
jgi:hypothetical protein